MDFPFGTLVTIRSTTTTNDRLGNGSTAEVEFTWGPCARAPRYARESADPASPTVMVGNTIYGPPTMTSATNEVVPVAIDSDDVLVLEGTVYEVDGEPEDFTGAGRNPFTGWEPGLAVPVKRAVSDA